METYFFLDLINGFKFFLCYFSVFLQESIHGFLSRANKKNEM
jgi:hypothetical protein